MELSAGGGGRILCHGNACCGAHGISWDPQESMELRNPRSCGAHGISWDPQESMELSAVWCVQCGIMEMHAGDAVL